MKKLFVLAFSVMLVTVVSYKVYASNSQGSGSQGAGNSQNLDQTPNIGIETQDDSKLPIQNQNQVKTQNQGDMQQLQVATQEQQGTDAGQGSKKGLTETRSSVAQKVQLLLSTESASGGIGDQVKEWARTQDQSQTKIQEHLDKVEGKKGLARSIFGPDYKSLSELKKEMEQNRVRVQQLEQLKLNLTNQAEISNVQEMITLMQEENTLLQDKINLEEGNSGLFGWLFKLFLK